MTPNLEWILFFMEFMEKDIENIIMSTPNNLLNDRGLPIVGHKRNQVKIGNYGIADVLSIQRVYPIRALEITIYELKKDKIGVHTFLQGIRYCRGLSRYLNKCRRNTHFNVRLAIIGSEIDTGSDFLYIPDVINSEEFSLSIYTYFYDFDGISFKDHYNYRLNEEGF